MAAKFSTSLDLQLVDNARDGNLDKVLELLRNGADLNAMDEYGNTPLICASRNGHLEVVRVFLNEGGVNVNAKGECDNTALIVACLKRHSEVICALLHCDGVDIHCENEKDQSALTVVRCSQPENENDDIKRRLEEYMERERRREHMRREFMRREQRRREHMRREEEERNRIQKEIRTEVLKAMERRRNKTSADLQFVELRGSDILLLYRKGRFYRPSGNVEFKIEVGKLIDVYKTCERHSLTELSQLLVQWVHQKQCGRFLMLDAATDRWYVVTNIVARQCALQTLREYMRRDREQNDKQE